MGKILPWLFRFSVVLAVLSIFLLTIVDKGTAEQTITIVTLVLNVIIAVVSAIFIYKRKDD